MKVKGLKVVEGILMVESKNKNCPYQTGHNCGDWCALFTIERPSEFRVKVNLSCSPGTSYDSY